MGTNELTDLMRDVWPAGEPFPKLERFLTLCRGPYQNGRNLEDEIDWSTLETAHSWEEFGNCCSQMDGALGRLEKAARSPRLRFGDSILPRRRDF